MKKSILGAGFLALAVLLSFSAHGAEDLTMRAQLKAGRQLPVEVVEALQAPQNNRVAHAEKEFRSANKTAIKAYRACRNMRGDDFDCWIDFEDNNLTQLQNAKARLINEVRHNSAQEEEGYANLGALKDGALTIGNSIAGGTAKLLNLLGDAMKPTTQQPAEVVESAPAWKNPDDM